MPRHRIIHSGAHHHGGHHHHHPAKNAHGGGEPDKRAGYNITAAGAKHTKDFNRDLLYTQGFPVAATAGSTTPVPCNLTAPGKWLHGISFIPVTGSDISNVQLNLVVNNNNVLTRVSAQNANPGFTQGILFFPTPQPLQGNDTITLNVTNGGGSTIAATCNLFYVPQPQ